MMGLPFHHLQRRRGFTLVEAIVVMVVTGILAGIMVLFIRRPVQNYTETAGRADLSDAADLALRRMARELRTALPNSIRLTVAGGVSYLQFIPTKAGGQYLAVEDNATRGTPLSFLSSVPTTSFDIVGPVPTAPYAIAPNDYIVIYNLGNGIANADAYVGNNRAQVSSISGTTVTLNANPFVQPAGKVPNTSPDHRFTVAGAPVTFRCEGKADGTGTLARSVDDFSATQPTPPLSSNTPLLANNVVGCDFTVTTTANLQTGVVGLSLALGRSIAGGNGNGNGVETVTLVDQIHVDNTP